MKTSRRLITVAAALAVASTLAACSSGGSAATSGEPVDGGTVTVGMDRDITSLDPAKGAITQQPTFILANALFDPLFTYADDGAVVPLLAQSLESDAAQTKWVMKLASDVTFSDGSPLGAQAVIDHITRLADPATACACARDAKSIVEMTAVDPTTIGFTLDRPNSAFKNLFTRQLGYVTSPTLDEFGVPLGSGPYVLTGNQSGTSITMDRNPEYWGERGHADSLDFKILPDSDSRYQSLVSGEVDLIWSESSTQFLQAPTDGFTASTADTGMSTGLFNTKVVPFDSPVVRQAVQAAIDRDVLRSVVNEGTGDVSYGPIPSTSSYEQTAEYPAFDQDRARKLVAEYGKPISFTYTSDNRPQSQQRATVIKQMLADVGIEMTLNPVDTTTWGTVLRSGDFQMVDMTTSLFGDADSGSTSFFASTGVSNFSKYANADVDALINDMLGEQDPDRRSELLNDIAAQVFVDAPVVFYTQNVDGYIMSDRVGGVPDVSTRSIISVRPSEFWAATS